MNVKFTKESKEYQIMQQFFSIMKKYPAINTDEEWAKYEVDIHNFINDEEVIYSEYRFDLAKAWTRKLKQEQQARIELTEMMKKYFINMQQYAQPSTDDDWTSAIAGFNEFANSNNGNKDLAVKLSTAWLWKVEKEYKLNQEYKTDHESESAHESEPAQFMY